MIRVVPNIYSGSGGTYIPPKMALASPLQVLPRDTVHFGMAQRSALVTHSATYAPLLKVGTYSVPKGHLYYDCFQGDLPTSKLARALKIASTLGLSCLSGPPPQPGVAKIASVTSLDPFHSNPAKAYACEVVVDLRGTRLFGKTVPGEHLSFLDISDTQKFSPQWIATLKQEGADHHFAKAELKNLANARLKNFTIASPMGGERDAFGNPTGMVKLIVRRVENKGVKGPMTNYLVNLKPGAPMVFAAPISHHFLGPTAHTPAVFFGVGSSVSPYSSMLRTRFELEQGPYADTYLAIGHTRPALEYYQGMFQKFAENPDHHFTYRPVYSKTPEQSGGIGRIQKLLQNPDEARKIFALVLNPQAHIYVSGFYGLDQQIIEALIQSAQNNPALGATAEQMDAVIQKAQLEKRFHVEGEIRQDLTEGLQGY